MASHSNADGDQKEAILKAFISEVSKIEERDSVYTSEKQIQRLLRPGSSYANLNPFSVLMVSRGYDMALFTFLMIDKFHCSSHQHSVLVFNRLTSMLLQKKYVNSTKNYQFFCILIKIWTTEKKLRQLSM